MDKELFIDILKNKNIKLNEQQKTGVFTIDGPVLILAVPGSGKTTVLVCRTAFIILSKEIDPKRILTLTFSRASASDMKERFKSFFCDEINTDDVHFSTIHSFAYQIVMSYAKSKGVYLRLIEGDGFFTNQGEAVSKGKILRQLFRQYNEDYITEDEYSELCREIGWVKNRMIARSDLDKHEFSTKSFIKIYESYDDIKKKNNWIDFDDMLSYCYIILLKNPNILDYYAKKYDYVQVDEGQDTSAIQHAIIDLLVSKMDTNNLFMVGDEDQSIYSFRGAEPKHLLQFKDRYKDAVILFMEQNFRSGKKIVELSNQFIKKNKFRYDKNLFTENEKECDVQVLKHKTIVNQTSFVINDIESKKISNQTAIIYRNNISALAYVPILDEKGIPFFVRDFDDKVFSHWVFEDIFSILNFIEDPSDFKSFSNIYYKVQTYMNKAIVQTFSKIYARERVKNPKVNVLDMMINNSLTGHYQKDRLRQLKFLVRKTSIAPNITQKIKIIRKEFNYNDFLRQKLEKSPDTLKDIESILLLLETLGENVKTKQELINKLNGLLKTVKCANTENRGKKALVLTTMHSAKGLEFENVYMIDLLKERVSEKPSTQEEKEELEEERRIFYVGMTRAKTNLYLNTYLSNDNQSVQPSLFLKEVSNILQNKEVESEVNIEDFTIGKKVKHIKFGIGEIVRVDFGSMLINFENAGMKQLLKQIVIQNKLLEIVE